MRKEISRRDFIGGLAGALLVTTVGYGGSSANGRTSRIPRQEVEQARREEYNKQAGNSYKTKDFSEDSDEVLLARMIFGEASTCSDKEKIAVAYSVINRVNDGGVWNGTTLREVILKPFQYSCFNLLDKSRKRVMNPQAYDAKAFENCLKIAKGALAGSYSDPTNGATYYYNPDICNPLWRLWTEKIGKIDTEKGPSVHIYHKDNETIKKNYFDNLIKQRKKIKKGARKKSKKR